MQDERYQVDDEAKKRELRTVAALIEERIAPGRGFAVFIFDYGEGGDMFYMSSARREDVTKTLEEWLAKEGTTRRPRGQLTKDDEGETTLAIGVKEDCVVISFPKATRWVAFPAEQAEQLAETIRRRATEARTNRQ